MEPSVNFLSSASFIYLIIYRLFTIYYNLFTCLFIWCIFQTLLHAFSKMFKYKQQLLTLILSKCRDLHSLILVEFGNAPFDYNVD